MSGISNIGRIRHYLEFVNDSEGRFEIDEPVGFDAAEFKIIQDEKRYGRDVSFSGEEIDFTFYKKVAKLGHQFDLLMVYDEIHGFESEIRYILVEEQSESLITTEYVVGQLDFYTKETDGYSYLSCKIIQDTNQAIIRRREDIDIDLFGTEDLDGNEISPVSTENILLPAKPVIQTSQWNATLPFWAFTNDDPDNLIVGMYHNPFNSVVNSGIENTLSFINRYIDTFTGDSNRYNKFYDTGWVDAQEDLAEVTFNLKDISLSYFIASGADFLDNWATTGTVRIQLRIYIMEIGQDNYTQSDIYPNGFTSSQAFTLDWDYNFVGNENIDRFGDFTGSADRYDITMEDQLLTLNFGVPRGYRISAAFYMGREDTIVEWLGGSVEMQVKSTAIPSVTKGIRLIDAMKQTMLNINGGMTVNSPRYDAGGEWYDNFVFDGNLLRGRDTKYIMQWKDIAKFVQEQNADYEIEEDEVFVGKYDDFYTNNESGAFLIAPDESFKLLFNERYGINKLRFKYKTFTQDKDDDNTIDGVHTDVQFAFGNKQVENEKEIEIPWIRDPFTIETNRKKAINSENSGTSSLKDDTKTHIVDVIPLAPGSENTISASLTHFVTADAFAYLKLLNDGSFSWNLLGFSIGNIVSINNTENIGNYVVILIEPNVLTLAPLGVTPTGIGVDLTEFTYPLTSVAFKMRESEGFDSITGIENPDEFANLLYTPKRNLKNNWSSYMNTASRYNNEDIKVKSFKNEPELETQFNGGDVITENADLTQAELDDPILTPRIIPTKVLCNFEQYLAFKESVKTVRGFIRVYDNENRVLKGFPQESSFAWADNILELKLEEKYDNPITDINYISDAGSYTIDEVGYDQDMIPEMDYVAEGDYIQFFDAITRPLTNVLRYDQVSVAGAVYENMTELTTAIEAL